MIKKIREFIEHFAWDVRRHELYDNRVFESNLLLNKFEREQNDVLSLRCRLSECEHDKKKLQGLLSKADAQVFTLKKSNKNLKIENHKLNNALSRTIKANAKKENTIVDILKLAESNKTPFAKKIADIARGDV